MKEHPSYTKLLYWQLVLWTFLLGHLREIDLRARAGSPGALEICRLLDAAGDDPTGSNLDALLVAVDEYRRALLN